MELPLLLLAALLATLSLLAPCHGQPADLRLPIRVGLLNPSTHTIFPMIYQEGDLKTPRGFDPKLSYELMRKLDLDPSNLSHVEYYELNSLDDRITAIKDDRVDLVLGEISVTEEREKAVNFVHPYYYGAGIVLLLADTDDSDRFLGGWDSIRGFNICLLHGTYYEPALQKHGAVLVRVNTRDELKKGVEAGACVAVALDSTDLQVKASGNMKRAKGLDPIENLPYAVAVSKNNPQLELRLSGAMTSLFKDGIHSYIFKLEQEFFHDKVVNCEGPGCETGSFTPLKALETAVKAISNFYPTDDWTVQYPIPDPDLPTGQPAPAAPSVPPTPDQPSPSGVPVGVIVGACVAGVAVCAVAIGTYVWWRRKAAPHSAAPAQRKVTHPGMTAIAAQVPASPEHAMLAIMKEPPPSKV